MNAGDKLDPLEVAVEVAAAEQLDPLEVVPNVVRSEVFGLFLNQWRTAQESRLRNVEALWWARWNEGLDGWSDGRSTRELVEQCGWDDASVQRVEQCLASLVNAAKEQKRRADAYQHATEAHKQANQQAREAVDPQSE